MIPGAPDEEADAGCDRCPKGAGEDIMWCYLWQEWLCLVCRAAATAAEHRMTLAEKQALDARAAEAS